MQTSEKSLSIHDPLQHSAEPLLLRNKDCFILRNGKMKHCDARPFRRALRTARGVQSLRDARLFGGRQFMSGVTRNSTVAQCCAITNEFEVSREQSGERSCRSSRSLLSTLCEPRRLGNTKFDACRERATQRPSMDSGQDVPKRQAATLVAPGQRDELQPAPLPGRFADEKSG